MLERGFAYVGQISGRPSVTNYVISDVFYNPEPLCTVLAAFARSRRWLEAWSAPPPPPSAANRDSGCVSQCLLDVFAPTGSGPLQLDRRPPLLPPPVIPLRLAPSPPPPHGPPMPAQLVARGSHAEQPDQRAVRARQPPKVGGLHQPRRLERRVAQQRALALLAGRRAGGWLVGRVGWPLTVVEARGQVR